MKLIDTQQREWLLRCFTANTAVPTPATFEPSEETVRDVAKVLCCPNGCEGSTSSIKSLGVCDEIHERDKARAILLSLGSQ